MEREIIPNIMAIRYLNGYVYCTAGPKAVQGHVKWREVNIFSPQTKIAAERAKIDSKYVNLRFCYNNKYWAGDGEGTEDVWLVARSEQPEEDKSKWSCTLFEPIIVNKEDRTFQLIHVQSGKYVRVHLESSEYIYVDGQPMSDCRFVDWNGVAMLPKHVTFKGDNGKYLEVRGSNRMAFSSDDGNKGAAAYEVTMNPHGYLLIRSQGGEGKYWTAVSESEMVLLDTPRTVDDNSLFWPVKVDDKTIALRNAFNLFCGNGKDDGLRACGPTITAKARLQVEELVLERQICNVTYHIDRARIYDPTILVLGDGTATNPKHEEANLGIKISCEKISSSTFRNSVDFELGVATTFKTGIPCIADGKITVSAEASASFEWNKKTTKSLKQEVTYHVDVPPGSSVTVKYVAMEAKCDVPFSYTQRDKLSRDGSLVITTHDDGVFHGSNYEA